MKTRTCPNCNNRVPEDALQCEHCKTSLESKELPQRQKSSRAAQTIWWIAVAGFTAGALILSALLRGDERFFSTPGWIYLPRFWGPLFILSILLVVGGGTVGLLIAIISGVTETGKKALKQIFFLLALFGAFGIFFLIFSGGSHHKCTRESARRSACVNNLKQMRLVFDMYAKENEDRYPFIDNTRNNFIFEGDGLYPEYLPDVCLVACHSDTEYNSRKNFRLISNEKHPESLPGAFHPDCITDMSYCYLGWIITNQQEAEAFFEAYDRMSPEDYDKDIIVPEGRGNGGGNIIYRLRPLDKLPPELDIDPASIPVIWDKPSNNITNFSHVPAGSNVLYLDGHVEFIRYAKEPARTPFPVNSEFAKLVDERPRAPIPDCGF
jgi:prepilin-type processing-associated H-X9-DG protein